LLDIPELAAGEGVGEEAMSFVSFLKFGFSFEENLSGNSLF
jgi:hypothetical protein